MKICTRSCALLSRMEAVANMKLGLWKLGTKWLECLIIQTPGINILRNQRLTIHMFVCHQNLHVNKLWCAWNVIAGISACNTPSMDWCWGPRALVSIRFWSLFGLAACAAVGGWKVWFSGPTLKLTCEPQLTCAHRRLSRVCVPFSTQHAGKWCQPALLLTGMLYQKFVHQDQAIISVSFVLYSMLRVGYAALPATTSRYRIPEVIVLPQTPHMFWKAVL